MHTVVGPPSCIDHPFPDQATAWSGHLSSGEKATNLIQSELPLNIYSTTPVTLFQSCAVSSLRPDVTEFKWPQAARVAWRSGYLVGDHQDHQSGPYGDPPSS
jgi:hypothetical protein